MQRESEKFVSIVSTEIEVNKNRLILKATRLKIAPTINISLLVVASKLSYNFLCITQLVEWHFDPTSTHRGLGQPLCKIQVRKINERQNNGMPSNLSEKLHDRIVAIFGRGPLVLQRTK
ncbi:MAG: hypothetical protein DCC59_16940 [Chloroflexi bacterium]|nr:MAG: hypothetical protein DCC59_16940 [Chloroflexota bacterium]